MGATHDLTTDNGTVTITPSNNKKIATWRDYDSTGNNYKSGFPKHYVGTGPAGTSSDTAKKDEITGGLDAITIGEHRRLNWVEETWVIKNDILNFKQGVTIKKRTTYRYGTGANAWKPKGWVGSTGLTTPAKNQPKVTWSVIGGVSNEPYIPGKDNFVTAVTTPGAARKKWKKELWLVHDTWKAGAANATKQTKRKRMAYERPARGDYLGFDRGYHNPFQPSCNFAINHNHVMSKAKVMLLIEPGDEEVKQVNFKALWDTDTTTYAGPKNVTTQETDGGLSPTRNELSSGTKLNVTQTGVNVGQDIDNLFILGGARDKKLKFQMEIIDHGDEQGTRLNDHGPCTTRVEPSMTVVPMGIDGERLKICTDADADFEAVLDNTIHFAVTQSMVQHDTAQPGNNTEYRIEILGGFNPLQASKRWEQLQDYYESSNYTYELDDNKIRSSKGTWSTLSNTSSSNLDYLPCFKMLSHTIDQGMYWDHSMVEDKIITVRVLENTGTLSVPTWTNVTKPDAVVKIKMKRAATEPIFWLPNFVYGTGTDCFDTPGDDGKPVAISSRTAIEDNSNWNQPDAVEYYTGGVGCVITPITSADVLEGNFYWEFTTRSADGTGQGNNSDKHIFMNELLNYHDSFIYEKANGETDEDFAARKPNGKKREIGGRPHIMRTSKTTGDSTFTDLNFSLSHSKGADTPMEITGYIVANGHKTQCQVLDYYCSDDDGTGDYIVVRPDNTDQDDRYGQNNSEIRMATGDNHLRIISQTGSIPSLDAQSISVNTSYSTNDTPLDLQLNMNVNVDTTDFRSVRVRMDGYMDSVVAEGDEDKQMDFTFTHNPATGYWSGIRTGTSEYVLEESEKIQNLSGFPMTSPSTGDNKVYPTMGSLEARIAGYDANGNWLTSSSVTVNNAAPLITTTTVATTTQTQTTATSPQTTADYTITMSGLNDETNGDVTISWSVQGSTNSNTAFEIFSTATPGNESSWVQRAHSISEGDRSKTLTMAELGNPAGGSTVHFRVASNDGKQAETSWTVPVVSTTTTATMTSMTSQASMTTTEYPGQGYVNSVDAYIDTSISLSEKVHINVNWSYTPAQSQSGLITGFQVSAYAYSGTTGQLLAEGQFAGGRQTTGSSATDVELIVRNNGGSTSNFTNLIGQGQQIQVKIVPLISSTHLTSFESGGVMVTASTASATTTMAPTTTTMAQTTTQPATQATTTPSATTQPQPTTSSSALMNADPFINITSTGGSHSQNIDFSFGAVGSTKYDLQITVKDGSNVVMTSPQAFDGLTYQETNLTTTAWSIMLVQPSMHGKTIQFKIRGREDTDTTPGEWSPVEEWVVGTVFN